MRRFFWVVLLVLLAITIVLVALWGTLAVWYRLPAPEILQEGTACIFAAFGLATAVTVFTRWRPTALIGFAGVMIITLFWWFTILPPSDADWSPDVARQVTGKINGDLLTLSDVRDFDWRSDADLTQRWETHSYDLSKVKTLDLFMSYWSGPTIAHVIMSFGFENGAQLAWSIEVRRRRGGAFSPVADLFKSNALVIVAADERDIVGVRSNVRGEDVQLYRLRASPEAARSLLLKYVSDANALAVKPQFYNSITTNCTTVIVRMIRAVGDKLPFDWRLIINGYLPEYAYAQGALDMSVSMSQLRALSHIDSKARADGLSPDFSRAIRVGVPSPERPLP